MKLEGKGFLSLKLKQHFKNLNYYAMPTSTLFVFRKRVHFLSTTLILALFILPYTLL